MANVDRPLVAISHYADVEQAERDFGKLLELGLHPVLRKPKDRADVQPLDERGAIHDLVMCVPEGEARRARETLELTVEAQGDAREEGYD